MKTPMGRAWPDNRPPRASDGAAATPPMATVLAWLWGVGAIMQVLGVVLPHRPHGNEPLFLGIAVVCAAWCAVFALGGGRLPRWVFQVAGAFGTLAITAVIVLVERPATDHQMLYLWVALYASYFFTRRAALAHLAGIGVAYAGVLLLVYPAQADASDWVVTTGGLAVVGLLVMSLRTRLDAVVAGLETAAGTDALTGLRNRHGFEELIDLELERSQRHGRPLSVLVADLDHFKGLNDSYGHAAGDAALEGVGELLLAASRRIDSVARVGGEEFALILPDTAAPGAYLLAERIRSDIERSFADHAGLTVSVGIASYPEHGTGRGEILRAADRALYGAKRLDRNRSVIYSDETARLLANM